MKIKSLRNIKTEALLIYIKTICQEYIEKIKNDNYIFDIGNEKCNKEILDTIYFLEEKLSKKIQNVYELQTTINYFKKNNKTEIPWNYNALIFYYNTIILEFEKKFKQGEKWIPEQIILALLSEWILEEEKSINDYIFLKEIDYFKLLSYFEYARNNEKKKDLKSTVKKMYKNASSVIYQLKNAKFKVNSTRKSKSRR